MKNEQIRRIQHMEELLDTCSSNIESLFHALEQYKEYYPQYKELIDYYSNGLWQQDYEDDNNGKIPQDMKRGVLSQDSIYDLIGETKYLQQELINILSLLKKNQ